MSELVELCVFRVGAEEYVVDIRRVEEVLGRAPVTMVPNSPDFVEGVIYQLDGVTPVIDLRRRLSSGPALPGSKPKLLVCRLGRRLVALRVDAVIGVTAVRGSAIVPVPALLAGSGAGPYVVGACGEPPAVRLLLDLRAVLRTGTSAHSDGSRRGA